MSCTDLTPRELEVVQKVLEGLSNSAIAQALNISEKTVFVHLNSILKKLKVTSGYKLFDILKTKLAENTQPEAIAQVWVSPRQMQVVDRITKSNLEIARDLNISKRTAEFYVGSLFHLCGVRSRREFLAKRHTFEFVLREQGSHAKAR